MRKISLEGRKMKTKTLHQSVVIETDPHDVYEALMDSRKHTEFTGAKAKIGRHVGDSFSVCDGWVSGSNVELIPDNNIVQQWRSSDWPEGHYSVITFEFKKI